MKKEVIIAIIIGITLGTIITFGVHTAQKSLSNKNTPLPTPVPILITTPTQESVHTLTINSPQSNQIVTTKDLTISGITSPNSLLSALSVTDQSLGAADESGNFELTLPLAIGANTIMIKAYNLEGQEASQEIEVIYYKELVEPSPTPEA